MLNGFLSRSDGIEVGGGVRADPVALALVGLGVAWLDRRKYRSSRSLDAGPNP